MVPQICPSHEGPGSSFTKVGIHVDPVQAADGMRVLSLSSNQKLVPNAPAFLEDGPMCRAAFPRMSAVDLGEVSQAEGSQDWCKLSLKLASRAKIKSEPGTGGFFS